MTQHILIVGATSSIGRAAAMSFAQKGAALHLTGRDMAELERISTDINIRYQTQTSYSQFESDLQKILNLMPQLDGVVFAIGTMEGDGAALLEINFTQAVIFLESCAAHFEQQKTGFIIGISSCAGDRGRQSNYLYGAAKGGLSIYLQGLRHRLFKHGVRVLTIKPGFVDTPMTFGLPGVFLAAQPKHIGKAIANAVNKKKDVVYLPWFWRYIMLVIKAIPECIFKRTTL